VNHQEAFELVKANVENLNILRHMLAVESIMRALAEHLGEDAELWGLTGLVHDIDYEKTADNFEKHGVLAQEMLKSKVPEETLKAIKAHNYEFTGVKPTTRLEKGLMAADAVSGLIVACALVMPSKKAEDVKVKTVKKKFKDKDFARGADRQRIALCEELGLPMETFFEIALKGICNVSKDLGI
jgi:putative nucleotidyltransferase with HDIG domain